MSHFESRTVGFKPRERNIFFHILTACNLSCSHCYINPEQHGTQTLDKETLEEWLRLFYNPKKETNVIFLGGEPTLHKDLAQAIKTANSLGYHSVTVDSNGFLFHNILETIAPGDAVLSFSLDGPTDEINDPIRGEGVYATCTENLKKAVAKGFDVSVIYTVSQMNIDGLQAMPSLLHSLGVKRFFIQVIGIRGKSASSEETLQLSPKQWLSSIPPVAVEAARKGIHVIYPKVFLEPGEQFECAGLVAENYFIFPNGRVYQCPLCEDFPVNAYRIENNQLVKNEGLNEDRFFSLNISEGCVMNKLLQPGNISYDKAGKPVHRISCCLLKQEIAAPEE
jgi:MoaA/NifB/PqqE/SkfB family radical SAM enzyme